MMIAGRTVVNRILKPPQLDVRILIRGLMFLADVALDFGGESAFA